MFVVVARVRVGCPLAHPHDVEQGDAVARVAFVGEEVPRRGVVRDGVELLPGFAAAAEVVGLDGQVDGVGVALLVQGLLL